MGIEIDAIQCYGSQVLLYRVEVWGGTISLSAWNEEKIQNFFLCRQLRVKPSTSYLVVPLEICPQFCRSTNHKKSILIYHKSQDMPNYIWPKLIRMRGMKIY